MATPSLIYCADGNARYAQIAIESGFAYGARLPATGLYFQPSFADQDYKNPDLEAYLAAIEGVCDRFGSILEMATVIDWESHVPLSEVISWAEAVAPFTRVVVVIPKVPGGISRLPTSIGDTPVRLGFSYPSGYGRANWSILYEMVGWPNGVHILGGPPHAQYALASGLLKIPYRKAAPDLFVQKLDIRSIDGSQHQQMANRCCAFFDPDRMTTRGYWPTLLDYDGETWGDGGKNADAPYEAFRRSCRNIASMWAGGGLAIVTETGRIYIRAERTKIGPVGPGWATTWPGGRWG